MAGVKLGAVIARVDPREACLTILKEYPRRTLNQGTERMLFKQFLYYPVTINSYSIREESGILVNGLPLHSFNRYHELEEGNRTRTFTEFGGEETDRGLVFFLAGEVRP